MHEQDYPSPNNAELGGRGQLTPLRTLQLFGSLVGVGDAGAPGDVYSVASFEPVVTGWTPRVRESCEFCRRAWRLRTAANAFTRASNADIGPLIKPQFSSPPPGAVPAASGILAVWVRMETMAGHVAFPMDLGETIDLYGHMAATVDIIGPNTISSIDNPDTSSALAQGTVYDAIVGIDAGPIESPFSKSEVRYTQYFEVAAGAVLDVVVPPFAVGVKIYKAQPGTTTSWTRYLGDPTNSLSASFGSLAFANDASLDEHRPIGPETHLRSDVDLAFARYFSIIWTIRP